MLWLRLKRERQEQLVRRKRRTDERLRRLGEGERDMLGL